jgi:hypothetical protein
VLKGALRYRYADHEEIYTTAEVHYARAGHLPALEAGKAYVEFSQTSELANTMEVVERNLASMAH